jgi:uncharacterized protein YraI
VTDPASATLSTHGSRGTRWLAALSCAALFCSCGLRVPETQKPPAGQFGQGASTTLVPSSIPTGGGSGPSAAATESAQTTTSVSDRTGPPEDITQTSGPVPASARASYTAFLKDLSGLDSSFQASWIAAMAEVATTQIVESAWQAANTVRAAHEHTVGELSDSHLSVVVVGNTARVEDCLDEFDWYVVEDGSGRPDPAVSRGHFQAVGALGFAAGRWLVTQFQPGTASC